jgi:hypothetical protein
MPIPTTAFINLSNTKARKQADEKKRREKKRKDDEITRKIKEDKEEEEEEGSSKRRKTPSKRRKTSSYVRESSPLSEKQTMIEELTNDFGEEIVSKIKWDAHTPPRRQCDDMVKKGKEKIELDWDQELGGSKKKTRKRKSKTSRKTNKYFFW